MSFVKRCKSAFWQRKPKKVPHNSVSLANDEFLVVVMSQSPMATPARMTRFNSEVNFKGKKIATFRL